MRCCHPLPLLLRLCVRWPLLAALCLYKLRTAQLLRRRMVRHVAEVCLVGSSIPYLSVPCVHVCCVLCRPDPTSPWGKGVATRPTGVLSRHVAMEANGDDASVTLSRGDDGFTVEVDGETFVGTASLSDTTLTAFLNGEKFECSVVVRDNDVTVFPRGSFDGASIAMEFVLFYFASGFALTPRNSRVLCVLCASGRGVGHTPCPQPSPTSCPHPRPTSATVLLAAQPLC